MSWLILLTLASSGLYAQSPEQSLQDLRAKMTTLQDQIDQELKDKDQALADLSKIEQQISQLRRSLRQLERLQVDIEAQIQTILGQQQDLRNNIEQLLVQFNQLLIRGYPLAPHASLKALLGPQEPQSLARQWAYHRKLAQSSAKTLAILSDQIKALEVSQTSLTTQQDTLQITLAEQQQQLATLDELAAQRQAQLRHIEARIANNTESIETLLADEARLERIVATAQEARIEAPEGAALAVLAQKGDLPMPVSGAVKYAFGTPRAGTDPWRGWMLETPPQAPVHAIGSGRVVYANWLIGYGLLIIIDHQDDILSLYAHNTALFFQVGDWIRQGEVIALAGEPALAGVRVEHGSYFELRHHGQPKDPAAWIKRTRLPSSPP